MECFDQYCVEDFVLEHLGAKDFVLERFDQDFQRYEGLKSPQHLSVVHSLSPGLLFHHHLGVHLTLISFLRSRFD